MEKKYSRTVWFKEKGFRVEPFSRESLYAESDVLLTPELIDSIIFKKLSSGQILLDMESRKNEFLFIRSGAGKTTFRKYIKQYHERQYFFDTQSKTLVVDYSDRLGLSIENNHLEGIRYGIGKAMRRLNISFDDDFLKTLTIVDAFDYLIGQCQLAGINNICIVVDNRYRKIIDAWDYWEQEIISFILNIEQIKLNVANLFFKFFLPLEKYAPLMVYNQPDFLSVYKKLEWNKEMLKKLLDNRVSTCIENDYRITTINSGLIISSLDIFESNQAINAIIAYGEETKTPRDMLHLFDLVVTEHFSKKRGFDELINLRTIEDAYDKLLAE